MKSPSKLTDEELIAQIDKVKNEPDKPADEILLFASEFNLKPGSNFIDTRLLYKLYKIWSKNPLNKIKFAIRMNLHFKPERTGTGKLGYNLDIEASKITQQVYDLIKDNTFDKSKNPHHQQHFERFLDEFQFQDGKTWVHKHWIRAIYTKWCKQRYKISPLGEANFHKFCQLFFEENQDHYMLNHNKSDYLSKDEQMNVMKVINAEEETKKQT